MAYSKTPGSRKRKRENQLPESLEHIERSANAKWERNKAWHHVPDGMFLDSSWQERQSPSLDADSTSTCKLTTATVLNDEPHFQLDRVTVRAHVKRLRPRPINSALIRANNELPKAPPPAISSQCENPLRSSTTNLFLRPCHICHRRPTTKVVLDAYNDCTLCKQRVCYICVRVCEGFYCDDTISQFRKESLVANKSENVLFEKRRICSSCATENIDLEGCVRILCLDCVGFESMHLTTAQTLADSSRLRR